MATHVKDAAELRRLTGKPTARLGRTAAKVRKRGPAAESKWENELAAQLKCDGHEFERQVTSVVPGRKFVYDFLVHDMQALKPNVLVEVQGGIWSHGKSGHTSGTGVNRDAEKINLGQLAGYVVLVVTSDHIKSGQALHWINEAIRSSDE